MIEKKLIKVKVPPEKFRPDVATEFPDSKMAYDSVKEEMSFETNEATGASWRMVHDGVKVKTLFKGSADNRTMSLYNIEEFATKKDALQRIKDLKLEYKA